MSLLLAGFPEKIAGLPLFTGVAIVRYRLYGIDLPIDRTLVYGVLAGTLALIYLGGVATTQTISRALTGQEEQPQPAVVVSTLVIAALTPKLVLVLLLRRSARWGMIGSQQNLTRVPQSAKATVRSASIKLELGGILQYP